MLMAPVVYLEDSIFHAHSLHALLEFFVEHDAGTVQIFVVHAHREHEVAEQEFWGLLAPRHFLPCLERHAHIAEIEGCGIVRGISQRHIGIEELQSLPFFGGWGESLKFVELFPDKVQLSLKGVFHRLPKRCVRDEMVVGKACRRPQDHRNH